MTQLNSSDLAIWQPLYDQSMQQLVLVDCKASWCAPCRALLPVLRKLATEYQTQLTLVEVDADEHPQLLEFLGVRGLPAVLFYWKGREVNRFSRILPESAIRALLQPYIESGREPLVREAQTLRAQQQWQQALDCLQRVLQLPDAGPADAARYAHYLMDACKADASRWLQPWQAFLAQLDPPIQRDPSVQQALLRWQLLQMDAPELAFARDRFRLQPDAYHRLELARALTVREDHDQAIRLLIGLLRKQESVKEIQPAKELLMQLLNVLPDRNRANRYRREWLRYERPPTSGSV